MTEWSATWRGFAANIAAARAAAEDGWVKNFVSNRNERRLGSLSLVARLPLSFPILSCAVHPPLPILLVPGLCLSRVPADLAIYDQRRCASWARRRARKGKRGKECGVRAFVRSRASERARTVRKGYAPVSCSFRPISTLLSPSLSAFAEAANVFRKARNANSLRWSINRWIRRFDVF